MKGGGFKLKPSIRCSSAIRRPPQELAILDLYQQTNINHIPQLVLTPTQRSLRHRPKTGIRITDQYYTMPTKENQTDYHMRLKTTQGSQRITQQSTKNQLETLADDLFKKTSINQLDTPQLYEQKFKTQPLDSLKILRSNSQQQINMTYLLHQQISNLDRFLILSNLGQGSYATVKLARDKFTEKLIAIKIYSKSKLCNQQRRQQLKREIHILKLLDHPNIIKYVNTIETQMDINLIVEYGGSKNLRSYLKQFPNRKLDEDDAKLMFRQIVKAVDYCHSLNIIHRDIKLENILLKDNNEIKLIDFGFSVLVNRDCKLGVFCGTPSYMAPELVNKQDYFGKPVDVWALGVLLYVLLTGHFPFKGSNDSDLYGQIKKGIYTKVNASPQCQKLISQMLTIRANERITTLRFAKDLQKTYGSKQSQSSELSDNQLQSSQNQSSQVSSFAFKTSIPQFSKQEIEKHDQTLKEQTQIYNERKKRNGQKFQRLTKEQQSQLVKLIKSDPQFQNQLAEAIIKHTEITSFIKKANTLKIMKSLNKTAIEFKTNMTNKIQAIFLNHQNQTYNKLKYLLQEKEQLMIKVLEQKLSTYVDIKSNFKDALLIQLNKTLQTHLEENCKKYAQALSSQLLIMYEGIAQIIGQHIEINKENKFEQELYQQLQKVKDYFANCEQQYVKRLQTDMNEHYINAIQTIIQVQQKLKLK
ncbi:unnamed protein product [Paramecium pentaurelia]|uniref:Protein kinase domain-containing protein n=1 Tax=Paramecium pentaurelia TaxID=43138 RepID=A0A8S1U6M1_9CILI|nr:unnamed protein product [Paramecium pentaurelia]